MAAKKRVNKSKGDLDPVEAALRESESNLRAFFENVGVGTAQLNNEGHFIRVNDRFCQITGFSREELLGGMGPLDITHVEDREADRMQVFRMIRGETNLYENEIRYVRKDGSVVWVHVTATAVRDSVGRFLCTANVIQDITQHKLAEEKLRQLNESLEQQVAERTRDLQEREEYLRAILETAVDAIITIDRHGIIQSANPAAERMFGYSAAEMLGQNVNLLMPSPYREEHDGYLARYLQTGEKHIIGIGREVQGRCKDGRVFPIELAVSEVDQLQMFTGIIHDVSERKKLEREVVEIASLEHRRIGQDLHDTMSQELTALSIQAAELAETLRTDPSNGAKLVEQMTQGLRRGQQALRSVMRGLLPVLLDTEGLMAALTELADRTQCDGKATCKFDCPEPVSVADILTATHLYFIAQEAVHNALKHAHPQNIRIGLKSNAFVILSVEDDGAGMPDAHRGAVGAGGLGLRIMRNRAAIIGARLTIEPVQPTGTRVLCTLPRMNHAKEKNRQTSPDSDRR